MSSNESAAEFVATVRKDHAAMMDWYNRQPASSLQSKYGATYPESWKQVLNWNGWKETRKAYLQFIQEQEATSASNGATTNAGRTDTAPTAESNSTANTTSQVAPSSAAVPKRKSRWGSAASTPAPSGGDAAQTKRGRWNSGSNTGDSAEVEQLRSQLRVLNYKIDHVAEEAARIDALPHDDRERSVSPPPSYVYMVC
jgi:hypothetical protein